MAEPVEQPSDLERSLQRDNRRLLASLDDCKGTKANLVSAAMEAAGTAMRQLNLSPVAPGQKDIRKGKGKGKAEVAVSPLSDWQLAKVTPSYNSVVAEERIEILGDKIEQIVAIQRNDHPVRELVVPILGDLVEGEMIFPGQAHRIDASLFQQVMIDGPRILGNFLRRMAGQFERVRVHAVIGNHGRIGRRGDFRPETNADAMLYEVTRQVLVASGQKNVAWTPNYVQGEEKWYEVVEINGQRWMLVHGNQFFGGSGISGYPYPNANSKILKWNSGGIPETRSGQHFEYVLAGHHHQAISIPIGRTHLWVSGSTESDNTYASQDFASMAEPSQWLLFVTAKGSVGAEYRIRL